MDTLQQDIDTLEQEKMELKERLKILSKETLLGKMTQKAMETGKSLQYKTQPATPYSVD